MDDLQQGKRSRLWSWGPNLAVFAVLVGLGWWGHTYHWTLPQFSQLFAAGGDSPQSTSAVASAAESSAAVAPNHVLSAPLPTIEFASAAAAHNCGIEMAVVESRSMDEVVAANGSVGYDQTRLAQLSVRTPGIVWRAEKHVGDVVQRGDLLAIVDSAEVGQAKANLLEMAVMYNLKTQELKRLEGLQNIVPTRELNAAKAAHELSRSQRSNALQKLVNLGFPLRLNDIESLSADDLAEYLHLLGLPASLDRETASANLIPLEAPFAGTVINCEIVRGETVEPSKPQYVIADISHMWINLDIRQEDTAKVKVGTPVVFRIEGEPRPVSCKLTWIGTEVDPRTRQVRARADAENPFLDDAHTEPGARRLLQAGAFGSAEIMIGAKPEVVVVLNDAMRWQWEIGRQVVFVASEDGTQFVPRVVSRGMVRDGYVQVLDGLEPGERVVTLGSRVLSSVLSERLQQRLGDNATAKRDFDVSPTPE